LPLKKELFDDILALNDVKGAVVLRADGQILLQRFNAPPTRDLTQADFGEFIESFSEAKELEVLYDNIRLYFRRIPKGYLLIVLGRFAHMSMVRLNCDILIPALSDTLEKPKGFGLFFKR
jgi:hypothetical protein